MASPRAFQKEISISSLKGMESRLRNILNSIKKNKGYANLPASLIRDLKLALAEGVGNAFHHGNCSAKKPARVKFKITPKQIEIDIMDYGKGFRLSSIWQNPPEDLATQGRGLWIVRNLVDQVRYQKGRPNRLVLTRKLTRPKSVDSALEFFDRLQEAIQALKPVEAIYEELLDCVMGLFNVERASFLIYDPEMRVLKVAISRGIAKKVADKIAIAPGDGVAGYVFKTSRPLLVNNSSRWKKTGPRPRGKGYISKSFVSIPVVASQLHIGEETLGVLNLTDKRDGSRFTQGDLKLLNLLAGQAASAIRIRNLIDTIKHQQGLNRELEIVREIQDRLIPKKYPKIKGVQLGGECYLSPRGGGDYYDVLKVGKNLRGVIADVSGHNVGSAITMASFRSIFRSLIFDPNTPGELVRAMRWALHEELVQLNQFISAWVFEYQSSGKLTVSGAGHPPIMVYRAKSKKWENVFSHHLPLGLADEARLQNAKLSLKKDDLVIFYTDGLFDPRMRGTGFDKGRFLEVVEANARFTPQKIVEKVMATLDPHRTLLKSPDDVAILVLKKK